MSVIRSIRETYGRDICRRCLNRLCRTRLEPSDCRYAEPYPQLCPCCGEMRSIVTGFSLSGRLKLLGKTPKYRSRTNGKRNENSKNATGKEENPWISKN